MDLALLLSRSIYNRKPVSGCACTVVTESRPAFSDSFASAVSSVCVQWPRTYTTTHLSIYQSTVPCR